MKHGNLSNRVMPSIVIVFEGLVGLLPEDMTKDYHKAVGRDRWWQAVDLFQLSRPVLSKMLDLVWNKGMNLEICTWMGHGTEYDEAALRIAERMDFENVPVYSVWSSEPDKLARQLPYLPRIARVYDPDPAHVFTYGGKGVYITDYNQLGAY